MFKIPRGTRDFTPKEMNKRRCLEECMRSTFQKFGYREIQTPMFENLELFTAKSGEAIIDEIYSFKDKGDRELALRPELTAPVMRFYVEKMQMEPKPLKLFYFGSCFRYDRPQKGRYREFKQAGCEIIGTNTSEAYAELIALAYNLLKNAGLKDIKLNIGNLNILTQIFKKINISKEQQKQLIPLIDKSLFDEVSYLLKEFGIPEKTITEFLDVLQSSNIKKINDFIQEDESAKKELSILNEIQKLLKSSFKINEFQIKMSIVRGLDYYKGVVFEIDAPILGAEKQLCGGGAYELIPLFGGKDNPSAGFAIGFDRTLLTLETEKYEFKPFMLNVYVIPVNEDMIEKSLEITQTIRNNGISADIDLLRRGIGKSLKYASSLNAEKVMIVGPRELKKKSVTIRDMKTGKQELIDIKDIVSKVKNT